MYITICEIVQCMRQGTQGQCTGMTQKDGMGREVQGGERFGTEGKGDTYTPVADSMYGKNHYNIVISLQLN